MPATKKMTKKAMVAAQGRTEMLNNRADFIADILMDYNRSRSSAREEMEAEYAEQFSDFLAERDLNMEYDFLCSELGVRNDFNN